MQAKDVMTTLVWWLTLFSETPLLSADSVLALAKLFAKLRIRDKRASEIMSAPVVTVGETTDVQGKPLLGKAAKESSIAGYCRQCPAVRTRLARGAAVLLALAPFLIQADNFYLI